MRNYCWVVGRGLQSLSKLKVLRLDFNTITQLSSQQLLCCSQLTSLDLSSNRLTSIAVSASFFLLIYCNYMYYDFICRILCSVSQHLRKRFRLLLNVTKDSWTNLPLETSLFPYLEIFSCYLETHLFG